MNLESERKHLEAMERHVKAGKKLIQQKEQKLHQIESQKRANLVRQLWVMKFSFLNCICISLLTISFEMFLLL